MYCDNIGLAEPTGKCTAGYYCPGGMTTPTPSANGCDYGYYCPAGSAT